MVIIGLTGNSGSGKSTVSHILKHHGAYIIDADLISREVSSVGKPAYLEILEFFGKGIMLENGEIDRKKLGEIVFVDKEKLDKLIGITHKYIVLEIKNLIAQRLEMDVDALIVIDAPLLIEAGLHKIANEVWVVFASRDVMIKRIMARDNLTEQSAIKRLNAQATVETLSKFATHLIENNGDKKELEIILKRLLNNATRE